MIKVLAPFLVGFRHTSTRVMFLHNLGDPIFLLCREVGSTSEVPDTG